MKAEQRHTRLFAPSDLPGWVVFMKSIHISGCVRTRDHGFARHPFWCCAVLLIALTTSLPAQQSSPKHVLLLYGFTEHSVFDSLDSMKSALRSKVQWPVDFDVEYIEGRRLHEESYENAVVENFRSAYSKQKLDLVIAFSYPALDFAVRHRDELFSSAPIVFVEVASARIAGKKWTGVTGVVINSDIVHETVDLALRLHPGTTTIAIVTNTSAFEKVWLEAIHQELARHQQLAVVDLVGLAPGELFEKVDRLPARTVVLFQEAPQEAQQPAIGPYEVVAFVGQRRPSYSVWPVACVGHGCIGGVGWDNTEQTALATDLVRRVLSGERAENIPIAGTKTQVMVDWRQLRRWHIAESALPPGSIVVDREPTFWERDRNYIIAGSILIVLQSLLIVGLLMQRTRKRKAEAVLRESEERFRVMADTTPSIVWMSDTKGNLIYLNDRGKGFTGRDADAGLGETWRAYVHVDDLPKVLELNARALVDRRVFSREYRLRRKDGVYRWMFDVASPRVNGDGSFAGFIGSAIDITDQKLAQEALENVSGRLIEAQERERTRIARDLHDDICQRLALLSMELEQANRKDSPPSTKKRLEEIRQHCADIASDVQSLSHQLHSSKLDYLGIAAAIRGFCKEFAKQHEVSVDFREGNVPTHVPKDVSLCLFRVAQEALHNAVKYSGVWRFVVELQATGDAVQLTVSDAGAGFDVESAKSERGLGLVSMQERVHLVHGWFQIESAPGAGTKVIASVPMRMAEPSSAGAESDAAGDAMGVA